MRKNAMVATAAATQTGSIAHRRAPLQMAGDGTGREAVRLTAGGARRDSRGATGSRERRPRTATQTRWPTGPPRQQSLLGKSHSNLAGRVFSSLGVSRPPGAGDNCSFWTTVLQY